MESDFRGTGVKTHHKRSSPFWLVLTLLLSATPSAHAHLLNTGFGPFYDGLTHLFVTPEDLLPVIALALMGGLRGPRFGRAVLFTLPAAYLASSTAGLLISPHIALNVPEIIVTIGVGALLAADRQLPLGFVVGLAILLGLIHGILNSSDLAKSGSYGETTATGVAVALFVSVSILAGQAASVRVLWLRVAARVAGSWIAAIGLLMLGWAVRAPA